MTHKQTVHKIIKSIFYILLSTLFYVGIFVFVDNDFLACSCLILCFTFLGFFIAVLIKKNKPDENLRNAVKESIHKSAMPLTEINKAYKYHRLDIDENDILKLYFNKDFTKRCVIYQESNAVKIAFEKLDYHDDSYKQWSFDFANWEGDPASVESGLYADVEIAIKENSASFSTFLFV